MKCLEVIVIKADIDDTVGHEWGGGGSVADSDGWTRDFAVVGASFPARLASRGSEAVKFAVSGVDINNAVGDGE